MVYMIMTVLTTYQILEMMMVMLMVCLSSIQDVDHSGRHIIKKKIHTQAVLVLMITHPMMLQQMGEILLLALTQYALNYLEEETAILH